MNNVIKELRNSSGDLIHGSEGTLTIMRDFYQNLYSSKQPSQADIDDYFGDIKRDIFLDKSQQDICEGKICIDECEEVLKKIKSNKFPGIDSIPAEFYKVF